MNFRKPLLIVVLIIVGLVPIVVHAQEVQRGSGIDVNCGDIIEGEFTSNYQENNYEIDLMAGDTLDASFVPVGQQLKSVVFVTGPSGLAVATSSGRLDNDIAIDFETLESAPKVSTGIVSANGKYHIRIVNFDFGYYYYNKPNLNDTYVGLVASGDIGVYTLYIGCTLRDGTVINPGDNAPPTQSSGNSGGNATTFSGIGFPGLAPVDFSTTNFPKLPVNTPFGGDISADNNQILGFKFDAAANDVIGLTINRTGNLNLGLVVLSADNKVVFQASLVTSSELTTTFTLPSAGQYTIGVFRIDLLPPAAPEPTAFQLQATLNP